MGGEKKQGGAKSGALETTSAVVRTTPYSSLLSEDKRQLPLKVINIGDMNTDELKNPDPFEELGDEVLATFSNTN